MKRLLYITVFILLLNTVLSYDLYKWDFEQSIEDTTDNNFDFTVQAGAVEYRTDIVKWGEYSLYLNSSTWLKADPFPQFQGNYSISMWIYLNSSHTFGAANSYIWNQAWGNNEQRGTYDVGGDNFLRFVAATGAQNEAIAQSVLPLDQWNHIVFTVNTSSTARNIYLNNQLVGNFNESAGAGIPASNQDNFRLNMGEGESFPIMNMTIDALKIYYNHTLDGNEINALYTDDRVLDEGVYMDNCTGNANYTTNATTLNITVYDESTLNIIETEMDITITYNSSSDETTTITQTNTGSNFQFCVYPETTILDGTYSLTFGNATYPERRLSSDTVQYSSTITQIKAYLLESDSGYYARFKTVDGYESPISSVDLTVNKSVNNEDTILEQQLTDDSGLATIWVNPDDYYTFRFTKTGYLTQEYYLRPTSTEIYNVVMGESEDSYNVSIYSGLYYNFYPIDTTLNNNTAYDFTFNLTSSYWNITNCLFYAYWMNDTLIDLDIGDIGTTYCNAKLNINTGNNTGLYLEGYIEENDNLYNVTYYQTYSITQQYEGTVSLKTFLDDIRDFGGAGFDAFGRALLALVAIIIIVGISYKIGVYDEKLILFLIWTLVLLFTYVNYFNITTITNFPDTFGLGHLQQYIVFYIITLAIGARLIETW